MQLVVYAALAVVGLLLGARWVRAADDGHTTNSNRGQTPVGGLTPGDNTQPAALDFEAGPGDVVVHVVGAVDDPGVFRLPSGSRVTDAVERAGGATRNAALDGINLAASLADGQQIHVPAAGVASGTVSGDAGPGATDAPISLGTATVEQLDTIEGIGPVTAAGIVEFRDSRGGLSSIDQLDEISGVGPATMEALRARLQP